jgi:hypothetical protein
VDIEGTGFSSMSNTILFNGEIQARGVTPTLAECTANSGPCVSGFLSFTVPSVVPGNYYITVENSNGTSNALVYTVNS